MEGGLKGILDFEAFKLGMENAVHFLEEAGVHELKATGEEIVKVAKHHASSLEHDPRDAEKLADTIEVQGEGVDKKGPYVDVGSRSPHALFQEFGTVNDPPHPFMRPAIEEITAGNLRGKGLNLAPRTKKGGQSHAPTKHK
jgi:HK97 gp10 family phage protein